VVRAVIGRFISFICRAPFILSGLINA